MSCGGRGELVRIVLAVLVTRQNKGVDKESAPCYGLPRLASPCLASLSNPFLSSLLRAIPLSFFLSLSCCACVRLCCCCCSHLLLFLYRDKSLINIKRTPDPKTKQTLPSTENNINFLNFEFESDRKTTLRARKTFSLAFRQV